MGEAPISKKAVRGPYIVWSPEGGTVPVVQHTTHGAAHHAAHKLSKKHPEQTFMVMGRAGRLLKHKGTST